MRIVEIENSHSIDFSGEELEFFVRKNSISKLKSYEFLYSFLMNAKVIKIASISNISNEILDMLHQNSEANIYIILKDFSTSSDTLVRFDSRRPMIAREVKELENSFIVIDNISYLFLNPLSEKENISISTSKEAKDLDFIFNYYFWNSASMEKLVDKIGKPAESPFPPFGIGELEFINISNLNSFQHIYIPRDKRFASTLDLETGNRYFSDDLKVPIFINRDNFQAGKFVVNQKLEITNSWKLQKGIQKNIDLNLEFIPKVENWDRAVKVQDSKNVTLQTMRSDIIESMKETKPDSFPEESYVNEINYSWKVLPPIKPQNAQKSALYSQFDEIKKRLLKDLNKLKTHLEFIVKESGMLSKWFSGAIKKANSNLNKIEDYRTKDINLMSIIDLNKFLNNEFKYFYQSIIKDENDFKEVRKQKEAEERWNAEKEKLEKELAKNKETLSNKESELNQLQKLSELKRELEYKIKEIEDNVKQIQEDSSKTTQAREKLETLQKKNSEIDDKSNIQKDLNRDISRLKQRNELLEKYLKEKYSRFVYQVKSNEMSNLKSSSSEYFRDFSIPKFALPEVGMLFENSDNYFLEISDFDELRRANELEKRYTDKNYRVVAKEEGE
jgi:hypothetical protein